VILAELIADAQVFFCAVINELVNAQVGISFLRTEPVGIGADVVHMRQAADAIYHVKAHAVGAQHHANHVLHSLGGTVFRHFAKIIDDGIRAEGIGVRIGKLRHRAAVFFLKLLAAVRAGAAVIGFAVDRFFRHMRFVPEDGSCAEEIDGINPFSCKAAEIRAVEAGVNRIHFAVGKIHVAIGIIRQKMRFVAGRASKTPVIHPDLQPGILRHGNDILHHHLVTIPVGVGKHVHDHIHPVSCHIEQILAGMMGHAIAVICGAKTQRLLLHKKRPPVFIISFPADAEK